MSVNKNRFPLRETAEVAERAILVGIDRPGASWPLSETMAELERLTATAGAEVVAQTTQRLDAPNPRTFVGSGKAVEISELCTAYSADIVIFDDELTPSQQGNLEKIMGRDVKVIDRTALILDIFALHATTREGRLQVKLAQNQYLYPRLRGMWAHLASNRMGGGVGSRFGEGESQLEVDRRIVRNRITSIRRELAELDKNRSVQRQGRQESGMLRVALAGYTNAGKSSLLNALTNASVLSYDKLFATLDSTTRKYTLPEGREITLTDTVGFIQKLPTTLVESFKSTLDEVREADIILHVVDASSDYFEGQMRAVDDVLNQIGAQDIPSILVLNKIDLLDDEGREALAYHFPNAMQISSVTHEGLDALIARIVKLAAAQDEILHVLVPYTRGDIVALAHERCYIVEEHYDEQGTWMTIRVSPSLASRLEQFSVRA
ncbi:GTPase HflX [Denitrobacterium detoxificans]|jgi:GTP-binding protein HflX|uniref:GTPase HflX n=1 Tax=Denitrobacterium detoxificans TaxID=79604 RepID=UPI0026EF2490|nr:GTPase HflX [Denitrobacterium detoxificans]MBE6466114.1 GTPase HflX [Denitrobacterium detoxificans]